MQCGDVYCCSAVAVLLQCSGVSESGVGWPSGVVTVLVDVLWPDSTESVVGVVSYRVPGCGISSSVGVGGAEASVNNKWVSWVSCRTVGVLVL